MKTNLLDKLLQNIGIGLLAGLTFFNCSQEDKDEDPTPMEAETAYVNIFHGAPDTGGINIILNSNPLNEQPFKYLEYSDYLRFVPGDLTFRFLDASTNLFVLVDTTFTFTSGQSYTVFAANTSNNIEAALFIDDLPLRERGKAMIRFIHMSPDSPNVEFVANQDTLTRNISFKGGTEFIEIDAGGRTLQLLNTEQKTMISQLPNFQLRDGEYYNFILLGFESPPTGNINNLKFVGIEL